MFDDEDGDDPTTDVGDSGSAEPSDTEDSDADEQSTDFVDSAFESSSHEPDPPSFDVTTGEDLVDRLPEGSEIPDGVHRSFWEMVVLIKIALLAISLGVMLAYFRGRLDIAAGLGLVGLLASVRLFLRIRGFDGD